MKEVSLSIIIPTRNRQIYCKRSIEVILGMEFKNFEIIVYDNSDKDILRTMLESKKEDERLKYYYHKERLSFVDNFNNALKKANGKFVIFIGDDDCVLPNIFNVIDYMENNNINCMIQNVNCVYNWPDQTHASLKGGKLRISKSKYTKKLNLSNSYQSIKKLLSKGLRNYLYFDTIKIYHGIVSKNIIDKVICRTGQLFGGLTPDMYASVVLSLLDENVYRINIPYTLSGICKTSGSADSASGKHTGDLHSAPHFYGHLNYIWDDRVPKFYSVETIWVETCFKAICDMGINKLIDNFNFNLFYCDLIIRYPQYKDVILQHCNEKNYKLNWIKYYLDRYDLVNYLKQMIYRDKVIVYENVDDISKAIDIVIETYGEEFYENI